MERRALTSASAGFSGRNLTQHNDLVHHSRRRSLKPCRRQARPCRARAAAAAPRVVLSAPNLEVLAGDWEDAYKELEMQRGYCAVATRYSPALIRNQALSSPQATLKVLARFVEMFTSLGWFFGSLFFDQLSGAADNSSRVRYRAAQLRRTLTRLGPSFIKAGQVLASRPDIVRADYMEELCTLQDDVPSFPDDIAFEMMEKELGRPIAQVFSSISERPIAAASLGQVYKAVLRDTGEDVAIKVQRPGVEPVILRDLFIFRSMARFINPVCKARLGCNSELILDEFGEKLLEELDYQQEARNIEDFGNNYAGDSKVKIPWVRRDLCGARVLVMEWIDGMRCTNIRGIQTSGIDVNEFIRCGVVSGLRQLLEFGLFHGDPHPGNIFALEDGRIAYVDFGNVAEVSQQNKQTLIDAVVHAVNEDYEEMAKDFIKLGFLDQGTDIRPIVPALEKIWADSMGRGLSDFNFRTVTSKFNELVFQYPIRIPERYALVIRSLLTQEGICMQLQPDFRFLEVAYPYVARRLLTDEDPALRERLFQVLFSGGKFQWKRLSNLIRLAKEGSGGLDLSDTVASGARVVLLDEKLRSQLLQALTEDNRLHIDEVAQLVRMIQGDIDPSKLVTQTVTTLPSLSRQLMLQWSDRVLTG
ncbi:g11389 [Coccomyxa viridis]|uniref:G11389 protein n=1 Tax=Coccomyxa viridis TaxID=1274662 RepID=A0ABP1G7S8_9CHLO